MEDNTRLIQQKICCVMSGLEVKGMMLFSPLTLTLSPKGRGEMNFDKTYRGIKEEDTWTRRKESSLPLM